ncbi:MAG: DUF4834 domain-containing protein [Sphingobacteriaceae bacterium]|nr:MAG: DUF4834 domain-containing protein [Pedobacter sp.]
MGLLRFLLTAMAIFWLIKQLIRLLFPFLIQKIVHKAQNQAGQTYSYKNYRQPDGNIRVDYIPPNQKNSKADTVGDFVDYEEIK